VIGGAIFALIALVLTFAVLPYARRWSERTAAIEAARDQRDRLEALLASEDAIRRALDARRAGRRVYAARLLTGGTPALAASELQSIISGYAEQSSVSVTRMNVVGEAAPLEPGLSAIPLQLTAEGDVYGLADFLARLQHGEKLVAVEEITVTVGSPRRDGTHSFVWSLRLRAPYGESPSKSSL
jgi:hypothetical protein